MEAMKILIDADGCPVVNETVKIAVHHHLQCLILCDTSHHIQKEGAQTMMFDKGADSVDFALVSLLQKGDIVITQDYGLAAMCLAKRAIPIHQDGVVYTDENIEGLLMARHMAHKVRRGGGRLKGPAKRTQKQTDQFVECLEKMVENKSCGQ